MDNNLPKFKSISTVIFTGFGMLVGSIFSNRKTRVAGILVCGSVALLLRYAQIKIIEKSIEAQKQIEKK